MPRSDFHSGGGKEIFETLRMVEAENFDIRTTTLGISLTWQAQTPVSPIASTSALSTTDKTWFRLPKRSKPTSVCPL